MSKGKSRERIVIPTHFRGLVSQFAIEFWFEKFCPNRQKFLEGVPAVYAQYVKMGAVSDVEPDVQSADRASLDAVALLVGHAVDREQSLVDWIESNNQTYPSTPGGWLDVCAAAGWLIIQVYVRELRENGGD